MLPKITTIEQKKLIGINLKMSLVNNKTFELWNSFMSIKDKIKNRKNTEMISLQEYDINYFENFNPNNEFKKWALVEVDNIDKVSDNMESFILDKGLYAVFHYKGSSNDSSIYEYIFQSWLPQSEYFIDNRPHFEILGEKYKNNDLNSEETIWIPIKLKQ